MKKHKFISHLAVSCLFFLLSFPLLGNLPGFLSQPPIPPEQPPIEEEAPAIEPQNDDDPIQELD